MAERLSIAWFAVIMGLEGLTLMWQQAERLALIDFRLSGTLLMLTTGLFLWLSFLYQLKLFRHREAVTAELDDPVQLSFFPTFSIALILLGAAYIDVQQDLSLFFSIAGAVTQLLFTLAILAMWMQRSTYQVAHLSPAWFIPIVGNILVPIVGKAHFSSEISWFFFSIGALFWLLLFAILLYRFFFHPPLPQEQMPTLFVFVAPPAAGFVAYVSLTGGIDGFARVLYYTALFLTLFLWLIVKRLFAGEFSLSWWASSFPMAAMAVATLLMKEHTEFYFFELLSYFMLAGVTLLIAALGVRTLVAVIRSELRPSQEAT